MIEIVTESTVSILAVDSNGVEREVTFTVREIAPQALITRATNREGKLRDIIKNLAGTGLPEQVMIDLYRSLVLWNFTTYNGQGGKGAKEPLDSVYPEQGALPGFEFLGGFTNAAGVMVHNIVKHEHAAHTSYQVLGGILVQMLKARVLNTPQLQSGNRLDTAHAQARLSGEAAQNKSISQRTTRQSRDVPPRLRLKVYERDRFRCVYCGRSPITDLTVELHVDHIVPFVRGGKTLLENLQTLCAQCNLGKGSRDDVHHPGTEPGAGADAQ